MSTVYPKELYFTFAITKTCPLVTVEPRIRDSGLTRSSSNVNYNLSTTAGNLWYYYAYSYCNRICLDTMSTQTLLWAVIWAICTEIDRCPDVISTSAPLRLIFSPPRISNVCTHVHVHIPIATVLKVLELLI